MTEGLPESWYFHTVPTDRLELYRHDLDPLLTLIEQSGVKPVLGTYPMAVWQGDVAGR